MQRNIVGLGTLFEPETEARMMDEAVSSFKKFGSQTECVVAAEELGELQKEMFKCLRGKPKREALVEETADVLIMLNKVCLMFGIKLSEIETVVNAKIDRQFAGE